MTVNLDYYSLTKLLQAKGTVIMNSNLKEIIFKILNYSGTPNFLRLSKKNTVTVLNLHRISDDRDFFYDPIKPEKFIKIIDYCCKHYNIISFEELNKATEKPKLILSFDDGYYDFIEYALPYLIKKGLPSNHNVVNECVNQNTPIWTHKLNNLFSTLKEQAITNDPDISSHSKFEGDWMKYYMNFFHYLLNVEKSHRDNALQILINKYNITTKCRMMSWDDLIYCTQNGVEIGSHSYHHDSLSTIKSLNAFEIEVSQSIKEISEKINQKVKIFALPNGQFNNQLIEYFRTTDIQYVLVVDNCVNTNFYPNKLNLVSRIGLSDNSVNESILKIELFHSKLKGKL